MENRIEILREYIDKIVSNADDYIMRKGIYLHLYGVSYFCGLIALRRNFNAELATMAGMLHDLYTYKTMDSKEHSKKGSILAKEVLDTLKITNDEETNLICNAIAEHSDKKNKHTDFTEILIDADVIQHHLYNISLPLFENEKERLENLKIEFGLNRI
jgi:HD superfamily phosphodiesterase